MKLVASTAIALSLTFSTQVGVAPVTANDSMENRIRQDHPVNPQEQIEDTATSDFWLNFCRIIPCS